MGRQKRVITNSTFACEAICSKVLDKYDLEGEVRCDFLQLGLNDTYEVTTAGPTYYLRVYRQGVRTRAEILGELKALCFLRDQGISVAGPILRRDGALLTRLDAPEGSRYAAVFVEARQGGRLGSKVFPALGHLTAQMHKVADDMPDGIVRPQIDEKHMLDEPLSLVLPKLSHRDEDARYLVDLAAYLKHQLKDLPRKAPEYGFIHADIPNIHVNPQNELTLFDFDCCGWGWRAYDIAVVLWILRKGERGAKSGSNTRKWNQLLRSYQSVRPLSSRELTAIKAFVPIRHIWLMGLHVGTARFHGRNMNGVGDSLFSESISFLKRWMDNEFGLRARSGHRRE